MLIGRRLHLIIEYLLESAVRFHDEFWEQKTLEKNPQDKNMKTNIEAQKLMLCRCISSSKGTFSGSMLVFESVDRHSPKDPKMYIYIQYP